MVLPILSQLTSALIVSPILPPELMYVTLRSVDTPVENNPLDATASEPPRSTETKSAFIVVANCSIVLSYPCSQWFRHVVY